jgi:hypothetical protein
VVIAGWPFTPRLPDAAENRGPWKIFHDEIYRSPQKSFPFWLVTGKELHQALNDGKPRMTFGSEGQKVRECQSEMKRVGRYKGAINGHMDTRTYRAWKKG